MGTLRMNHLLNPPGGRSRDAAELRTTLVDLVPLRLAQSNLKRGQHGAPHG